MLQKFNALSLPIKLLIGAGLLVVVVFIFDATTGYVSDAKSWLFDRQQAKIEQENQRLLDENVKLRQEKEVFKAKAVEAEVRGQMLEKRLETINAKEAKVIEEMDKALEEQKKIEEQTAQETDAYTRCLRMKQKMLDRKIPSAPSINCEVVK